MEKVSIDVQKWTGLRGNFHPYTEVVCDAPQPLPEEVGTWQQWAADSLLVVARAESWQAGRYHYAAQQRDGEGHTLTTFARGTWDWHTDA